MAMHGRRRCRVHRVLHPGCWCFYSLRACTGPASDQGPCQRSVSAGAPLNQVFSQVTPDGYEYDQDLLALNFDPRGEARVTVSRDG